VEEDEEEDEESVSPFEWWKGSDGTSMMRMLGGFEGARDSESSTRVTDGVGWKAWSVQLDVQRAASTNGLRFWWYDHALSLCVCACVDRGMSLCELGSEWRVRVGELLEEAKEMMVAEEGGEREREGQQAMTSSERSDWLCGTRVCGEAWFFRCFACSLVRCREISWELSRYSVERMIFGPVDILVAVQWQVGGARYRLDGFDGK